MTEMLPLFPLGTVLYPGLVLPLNIFEERYRQLVRDLVAGPEPRQFGVIAIREGRETGVTGVSALYEVGCLAAVREITELPDGRYELATVGTDRFRLHTIDESLPYLRGEIELLDEPVGEESEAALLVSAVHRAFHGYLDVLAARGRPRSACRNCQPSRSCFPIWWQPRSLSTCQSGRNCWRSRTPSAGSRLNDRCCLRRQRSFARLARLRRLTYVHRPTTRTDANVGRQSFNSD